MFGRVGGRQGGDGGGNGKVCEFFLQGRCKFGDNCKYEHPGSRGQPNNNRFAALSNAGGGGGGGRGRDDQRAPSLPFNLNRDIIIADLQKERPQWPLSAYGPGKDAPRQLFGGHPLEQSPEELRVMYYLAQAGGNPQPAIQAEQELTQQLNQQIQKILSDPDGAIKYIIDGDNEHPNRRDMSKGLGSQNSANATTPFGTAASGTTSAFGQPSLGGPAKPAFGAPSFGQPANPLGSSSSTPAFGQLTQPGSTSAFGQPSQVGGSAFGQPSQPAQTSAFGQPTQMGAARSTFGQPSQPGNTTAFGQPSQPGAASAFGQPSGLGGTTSAFGQPSGLGQNKPAFGSASQPSNPFSNNQTTSSAFGQASQPSQASPFAAAGQNQRANTGSAFGQSAFGQPSQSPFVTVTAPTESSTSPFAQANRTTPNANPFGQPSQPASSPFAQPPQQPQQANTSAVKTPFSAAHGHPAPAAATPSSQPGSTAGTATPDYATYATSSGGQLRSWRGSPVTYLDGAPYYSKTGNVASRSSLERIWCPDGPPPPADAYTQEAGPLYAKAGPELEGAFRRCAEVGAFEGGIVPVLAPLRAWVRFDL